jgi:hypothetical protein
MNNSECSPEWVVIGANFMSAGIGLILMQSKYRGYTLVERLSLTCLIGALVANASWHLIDGTPKATTAEALLSVALLFRFLTTAAWRFLRCSKCPATVISLVCAAVFLLSGCGTTYQKWDSTHERTYGVSYDADSQTGAVTMTIRPASATSSTPTPATGMSDEVIAKIVKILYEQQSVKTQAAKILETPALK